MEANSYSTTKPVVQATNRVESVFTHSGPFHFDDVLATALIKVLWEEAKIVRTRDQALLAEAKENPHAVLADVGGEFDSSSRVFDHHFVDSPKRDDGTPYAAAGLVWVNLVGELLQQITTVEQIAVLEGVIKATDSTDNGVKVGPWWTLSLSVHKSNPVNGEPKTFDERFAGVVLIVKKAIEKTLLLEITSIEQFQNFVEEHPMMLKWVGEHELTIQESSNRLREALRLEEGNVLVLPQYEPAMHDVLWEAPENVLFVVFPSPSGEFMVQQIPTGKGSFAGRKKLPSSWAGKRGADLDAVAGVEGSVFCHPARFIAGHKTVEGAKQLALLAVSEPPE
jgi:uncharacterized UPF0160 family protein